MREMKEGGATGAKAIRKMVNFLNKIVEANMGWCDA